MTFGKPLDQLLFTPIGVPTVGPREAMAECLAEYMRSAVFRVWGGDAPDVELKLTTVQTEWPDASAELNYPCASIVEQTDTFHEGHNFVPTPLEDTLGVYDPCGHVPGLPQTVLWKISEASVHFQLDFWTSNKPDRQAIEAELGALFSPGEGRSGALIGGHPRYFDRPVRCTLLSHRRVDTGTTTYANERRLQCAVRAEIDIVRLYRATLLTPSVTTDATDPNDMSTLTENPLPPDPIVPGSGDEWQIQGGEAWTLQGGEPWELQ